MQKSFRSQIDIVNPLIKLVREREDLYFQLLSFVNSHLTSSSNDLDNTTVFNKFISLIDTKHNELHFKQQQFLSTFADPFAEGQQISDDPISKQMLRLSARLLQILEASMQGVRRSVFEDNGRAIKQFTRFKSTLNKIIKQDFFIPKDFTEHIVSYCINKYSRQFLKLKKYVEKVKQGDDIWFKQLYYQQKSDVESSPDEKRNKEQDKTVRKLYKKIDMDLHLSSTEEPEKKAVSLKKTLKTSLKKRDKVIHKAPAKENDQSNPKEKTATKLYKFYGLLELHKKQFLQDYIFDQINEEKHKEEMMNKLLERNKTISSQINVYYRKNVNKIPLSNHMPAKSSGDQRTESVASKVSLRTSFVINKRKSSFHFDSSVERQSTQKKTDNQNKQFQTTIKNLNPRKRASYSNHRTQKKSEKLFVVKAPMVFQEQIIPQAQITQAQWHQAPISVRCKQKKVENIRLKRKNNVNPLQNAFLPQNFRYPF